MRLIDADSLIDDLIHDVAMDQDSLDYEELTDSNREIIQFDKDCKQNAIDLLKNAPTIEPEQKKGEWLEHYAHEDGERDGVWCSECREHYYFGGQLMNFCPNCGADMRGDEHEL